MECNHIRGIGTDTSRFCVKCGYEFGKKQWSKESKNVKYKGEVIQGTRGYFIRIYDENGVEHRLTQKEVKNYETKTKKSKQELADFLAEKTEKIWENYNGKYHESSITIDLRSVKEKKEAKIKSENYWKEIENKKIEKEEKEKKIREKYKNNPLIFEVSFEEEKEKRNCGFYKMKKFFENDNDGWQAVGNMLVNICNWYISRNKDFKIEYRGENWEELREKHLYGILKTERPNN